MVAPAIALTGQLLISLGNKANAEQSGPGALGCSKASKWMNDKSSSAGRKQHHDLLHWDLFPKVPFKPKSAVFHCFPFPATMLGVSCPALAAPFGSSEDALTSPASLPLTQGSTSCCPGPILEPAVVGQPWPPQLLGMAPGASRALEGLLCHHILSDTALLPCTAEQMETCCPSVSCSCTIPPTSFILVLNPSEWGSFNEF